jgi:hypothetical protein
MELGVEVAMAYTIKVNGIDHIIDVDGDTPLLWVLRDTLGASIGGQWFPSRYRYHQTFGHGCPSCPCWTALLWGLGAFGQPGVERVLDIHRETRAAMQQVGAPSIKQLIPAMLQKASA